MKLKSLEVERLKLEAPFKMPPLPGREVYIHPLVGSGAIDTHDDEWGYCDIRGRRSIFSPPTPGWLLDGAQGVTIIPDGPLDVLVASTTSDVLPANPIKAEPRVHEIGERNYKRTVYEILGGDGPSARLRLGETSNANGGWSSWPPHSFDHKPELAPEFEEVFLPFMRPRDGLALLRRKGTFYGGYEVDDAIVLKAGAMVSVPLGSHPIVGGPDTELMYVWAYVCPVPKLYSKWADEVDGYA